MTVLLEGTTRRWIGLSTDEKPRPGQTGFDPATGQSAPLTEGDVPAGSSFLETDTGRIYRWNGEQWTVHVPENENAEYLAAILFKLASIEEAIIEGFA